MLSSEMKVTRNQS